MMLTQTSANCAARRPEAPGSTRHADLVADRCACIFASSADKHAFGSADRPTLARTLAGWILPTNHPLAVLANKYAASSGSPSSASDPQALSASKYAASSGIADRTPIFVKHCQAGGPIVVTSTEVSAGHNGSTIECKRPCAGAPRPGRCCTGWGGGAGAPRPGRCCTGWGGDALPRASVGQDANTKCSGCSTCVAASKTRSRPINMRLVAHVTEKGAIFFEGELLGRRSRPAKAVKKLPQQYPRNTLTTPLPG